MHLLEKRKAFCMLEYARTQSNKIMQREFVRKFSKTSLGSLHHRKLLPKTGYSVFGSRWTTNLTKPGLW